MAAAWTQLTQFSICPCKGQYQEKLPSCGRQTVTVKAEQQLMAAVRVDVLTRGQRCWNVSGESCGTAGTRRHMGADGGGREGGPAVHLLHGTDGLNLLWTSSIPSVEEQQDWVHRRRLGVGSWSILSPVHTQKALGKEGPLAFLLTWRVMPQMHLCLVGKELWKEADVAEDVCYLLPGL